MISTKHLTSLSDDEDAILMIVLRDVFKGGDLSFKSIDPAISALSDNIPRNGLYYTRSKEIAGIDLRAVCLPDRDPLGHYLLLTEEWCAEIISDEDGHSVIVLGDWERLGIDLTLLRLAFHQETT